MNGSWSEKVTSDPGMTNEQLIKLCKDIILEAKQMEKAAYARNDAKNAEYWIGKTVAASTILMHLEAKSA